MIGDNVPIGISNIFGLNTGMTLPTDLAAVKPRESEPALPSDTADIKAPAKPKKKTSAKPKTEIDAGPNKDTAINATGPTPEITVMREGGLKMLTSLIDKEKEAIDIHIYIITANTPELMSSLKNALHRGVKVRMMVEDDPFYWSEFKSDPSSKAVKELCAEGAEYKPDNPKFGKDRVTHEKSILFKGSQKALILTGNLGSSTFDKNLDLGAICVDNKKVFDQMQTLFNSDWDRTDLPEMEDIGLVISPDNAREKLEGFIGSARKSIHILQQGFSDKDIISLLGTKLKEGVEEQITLTDPGIAQGGMQTGAYLALRGAKVKYLTTPYIHAKAISIDSADADKSDDRGYIGSQNFSFSAINKNRELGILFNDKTDQLETIMDRYREKGFDIPSKMVMSDNSAIGSSMKSAIRTAEKSVIVQTNLFSDKTVRTNLIKAAQGGVSVKVMMPQNPFSWDPNCKFNIEAAEEMKAAGVEVQWTDPTYKTMQGTTMVVDGKEAFMFGDNISASAFKNNDNCALININEKEVGQIQAQLEADFAGKTSDVSSADPTSDLVSSPGNARARLTGLLKSATSSIFIETKDLSDAESAKILKEKAKSGIPVKVIVPAKKKLSDYETRLREELKAAGVTIQELSFEGSSSNVIEIDREQSYVGGHSLSRNSLDSSRSFGSIATQKDMVNIGHRAFEEHWLTASVDGAQKSISLEKKFVSDGDRDLMGLLKSMAKQGVQVTVTCGNFNDGLMKQDFDSLNDKLKSIADMDPAVEGNKETIAKFFNCSYDPEKGLKAQQKVKALLTSLKPGESIIQGAQKDASLIVRDSLKVDGQEAEMLKNDAAPKPGGDDADGGGGTLIQGLSFGEIFQEQPELYADAEQQLARHQQFDEE